MMYDYLRLLYPPIILGAFFLSWFLTHAFFNYLKYRGQEERERRENAAILSETYKFEKAKSGRGERRIEREIFTNPEIPIENRKQRMKLEEIINLAKELFENNRELKNDEELIYSAVRAWLIKPIYFIKDLEGLSPINIFEQQKEEKLIKWLRMMNWRESIGPKTRNTDLVKIW